MAFPRRKNAHISGSADVGTSSDVIVERWDDRLELTIVNNSAADVSLKLQTSAQFKAGTDPTAVADEGVVLVSGGGSWTTTSYTGPIAAIAGSAVSVAVMEI